MLITLAIIGVVAALTIPTVVKNYQKTQTITKLKKAYSILNQAVQIAQVENGSISSWDWTLEQNAFVEKYFLPYLKITKKCPAETSGCYTSDERVTDFLNKTNWIHTDYYKAKLADGMLLAFRKYTTNPENMYISVDINAEKTPNVAGRDFFNFNLGKGQMTIKPNGYNLSHDDLLDKSIKYSCTKTVYGGSYCAALIIKDGWEIKSYYPW